jgi:hypothetical protein
MQAETDLRSILHANSRDVLKESAPSPAYSGGLVFASVGHSVLRSLPSEERPKNSPIPKIQQIAKLRGGECLSTRYVKAAAPLLWRCALGHRWRASLASVTRRNTWCPTCAGNRKLELADLRKLARERGGRCLSRHYVNGRTPLLWECAFGHRWKAAAEQVKGGLHKKGTWCPKCYDQRRTFRPRGTVEEMQVLARSRGGIFLSRNYLGSRARHAWECALGHRWRAVSGNIKRGNWCPVCAGNRKSSLRDYRALAIRRGGKCLSTTYTNNDNKLRWRCSMGHEWRATGSSVRRGSWCARCAHKHRTGAIRRKPGQM